MSVEGVRVSPQWLALREPADAAARARDLAQRLCGRLPPAGRAVIHDLGAGTGAMGRWLAPLLPGPQHWILHDRDAGLLALATGEVPGPASDGSAVTVEVRRSDIAGLPAGALADATVVTASALLDMLTEADLTELVTACAAAGCPILLTLTVVGRVALNPAEALDARVSAAFNAHQRRATERGRLLGPDAVAHAVAQFQALGAEVLVAPSPWHLCPGEAELVRAWFAGWVAAACEQDPALEPALAAKAYAARRLAQLAAGGLAVTVDHSDVLVLPGQAV